MSPNTILIIELFLSHNPKWRGIFHALRRSPSVHVFVEKINAVPLLSSVHVYVNVIIFVTAAVA